MFRNLDKLLEGRYTTMKRILFYCSILFVIILAGCSLDNKTEKDAINTLVDAVVEDDADTLDELTDLKKDDQKALDRINTKYEFTDKDKKACTPQKSKKHTYTVLCNNDKDDNDPILMNVHFKEDDKRYIVDKFDTTSAKMTFREDDKGLTDEIIEAAEEEIGGKLEKQDKEKRNAIAREALLRIPEVNDALKGDFEPLAKEMDFDFLNTRSNEDITEEMFLDNVPTLYHEKVNKAKLKNIHVLSDYDAYHTLGASHDKFTKETFDDFTKVDGRKTTNVMYEYRLNDSPITSFVKVTLIEGKDDKNKMDIADIGRGYGPDVIKFEKPEKTQKDTKESIKKHKEKQRKKREKENKKKGKDKDETAVEIAGEEAYKNSCASCHANDLSGSVGPDISKAGEKYDKDELKDIMVNGKGDMPAGLADEDEAEDIAKWLKEKAK